MPSLIFFVGIPRDSQARFVKIKSNFVYAQNICIKNVARKSLKRKFLFTREQTNLRALHVRRSDLRVSDRIYAWTNLSVLHIRACTQQREPGLLAPPPPSSKEARLSELCRPASNSGTCASLSSGSDCYLLRRLMSQAQTANSKQSAVSDSNLKSYHSKQEDLFF